MFKLLTCKRNHNFESRASCKTIKNRYHGLWVFLTFPLSVFEEKSPYRVGRHVEINLKLIHMAFCGVNRCLENLMMLF